MIDQCCVESLKVVARRRKEGWVKRCVVVVQLPDDAEWSQLSDACPIVQSGDASTVSLATIEAGFDLGLGAGETVVTMRACTHQSLMVQGRTDPGTEDRLLRIRSTFASDFDPETAQRMLELVGCGDVTMSIEMHQVELPGVEDVSRTPRRPRTVVAPVIAEYTGAQL